MLVWRRLLCVLLFGLTLPQLQAAEPSVGAIVGTVTTPAGAPVPHATVTALRADGGAIRATISGSDGVFSFSDLPPGTWSITVDAAGASAASVPALAVAAGKATRHDIVMNLTLPAPAAAPAVAAASPSAAAIAAVLPEALQAPEAAPAVDTETPFAVGDLGWMNGTTRNSTPSFDTKFFTPEVRFDVNYLQDFNHPGDHTIVVNYNDVDGSQYSGVSYSLDDGATRGGFARKFHEAGSLTHARPLRIREPAGTARECIAGEYESRLTRA